MPTDHSLTEAVIDRLAHDARIPAADEIAVAADQGFITLRGTVERFSQRRAAIADAEGVDGVAGVDDELRVNLLGADRRDDDKIRGAALQSLMWDVDVPADLLGVTVSDGWVTLTGEVSFQYQSDAAYNDVARLSGVLGVTNKITVLGY